MEQIIFLLVLVVAFGLLGYSFSRVIRVMKQLKPFKISELGKRFVKMLDVAIAQSKILKRPVIGMLHALVFWGFLVILFGSIEMIIDGLAGTERVLGFMGVVYDIFVAGGDIFALLIAIIVFIFILRRTIFHVARFGGKEMTKKSHLDALFALFLIFTLMISLLGINTFYIIYSQKTNALMVGYYPVSNFLTALFSGISASQAHILFKINWWVHILVIFLFANILPYSKHFHVFMSVPNVFLSRLQPLGKMDTMNDIKEEVKAMMNPETAFDAPEEEPAEIARFGMLDATDASWKNFMDSLACTQCGRCTSVCPANITGKLLSPRKIMMNYRARMKELTPAMLKKDAEIDETNVLVGNAITEEELWACTTCNACAFECPISINQPNLILEMRRYLVMEQSSAPSGLITTFQNIENNGAPWQFNFQDRLIWSENLQINNENIKIPVIAECPDDKKPDFLLWVGSAGAFDDRYKKVIRNFVKILHHLNINYAVLGTEEADTGDVARRAGNEMLFQMQAMTNIEIMNAYGVKKIITCDPHDYNTLKHDYPDFDGNYELIHHTEFLNNLLNDGSLKINPTKFKNKKVTFHDPCYLARINSVVQPPRQILNRLNVDLKEMKRHGVNSLCCGAGGGQMFKEAENGNKEIFIERTEEAIKTDAEIIVTACPFCMTMMTDGIKYKNQEQKMINLDIAEMIATELGL